MFLETVETQGRIPAFQRSFPMNGKCYSMRSLENRMVEIEHLPIKITILLYRNVIFCNRINMFFPQQNCNWAFLTEVRSMKGRVFLFLYFLNQYSYVDISTAILRQQKLREPQCPLTALQKASCSSQTALWLKETESLCPSSAHPSLANLKCHWKIKVSLLLPKKKKIPILSAGFGLMGLGWSDLKD